MFEKKKQEDKGSMENMENMEGGYVFLSHSHLDIRQVRKIRNKMEEEGFEPLCFYLKCLDDDSELESLIEREIDAREWFVYVDSPNARNSKWVKKERAYIEKCGNKKIMTIDLESGEVLEETAERIMRSLRVFLSYAHKDEEVVKRFRQELLRRDLQVWTAADIMPGVEWEQVIRDQINQAAARGGIVIFVSEHTMKSVWQRMELEYAMTQGAVVLPIVLGDVTLNTSWKMRIGAGQCCMVDRDPTDEEIRAVVDRIEQFLLQQFG